jgi:hypothetical protein
MKKITFLSFFCFLLLTLVVKAQTPPNAFNYSAVARNAAGQPIATATIGIQITILKTSATGASQYIENHFVITDGYGLFNLVIGAGSIQSGSMATIDWSNDIYFLKVDMDTTGGNNFLAMDTTQLLSVPYALHAKTAESIIGGGSSGSGFSHYIGEEFGGGVIFHLWKDVSGLEHGLIVGKTNLSSSQVWSNVNQTIIGTTAQNSWNGLSNSNAVVSQTGHTISAALLCLNSTSDGQNDWYLPSIDELSLLWHNRFNVNKSLSAIGLATVLPNSTTSWSYWSSTECEASGAMVFFFDTGSAEFGVKNNTSYVRAVRAF